VEDVRTLFGFYFVLVFIIIFLYKEKQRKAISFNFFELLKRYFFKIVFYLKMY